MSKMGICCFTDGSYPTDFVAPKANYPDKESFMESCKAEFDYDDEHLEKIVIENVKESYCRYFPTSPDGVDNDGGCYSFSKAGRGSFPVWYIELR